MSKKRTPPAKNGNGSPLTMDRLYRPVMLVGSGIISFFLYNVFIDIRDVAKGQIETSKDVAVIKRDVAGIQHRQDEQQKEFSRFERDQSKKFERIQDELGKKADRNGKR